MARWKRAVGSVFKDAPGRTSPSRRILGRMPSGDFRCVFLLGRFAVKVPRIRFLSLGMRCNRWEREMWRTWRPIFGWKSLCPILFADLLGLVVVMPRAAQPVTFDDVVAATPDDYPLPTHETKPADFGKVQGRVLALDYGLASADDVREQRTYYTRIAAEQPGHCLPPKR
jgi:hypothetical protein